MKARIRFLAAHGLVAAFVLAALATAAPAAAAAGDIGYKDGKYDPASGSVTGTKPESKLWFNHGWRAIVFQSSASEYRIYRLDTATGAWSDSGVAVDPRNTARADVLWDGAAGKLYVSSHPKVTSGTATTADKAGRLYRYSYDAATDRYSLDAGFPVAINAATSETLVIDKDSTGTLWATWTQDSHVYVAHTVGGNDAAWGKAYIVPGASTTLTADDVSSVIHFGTNKIGVMWSNQSDHNFYFSVHADGANDASWSTSVVPVGVSSDDHINLKADSAGDVFAALKSGATGKTSPLTLLMERSPSGAWTSATFGTVADSHTRPIVVLDEQHALVHMFATCPQPPNTSGQAGGDICEKTASMLNPAFAPGMGTTVIREAGSPDMNDVTSTKQSVDGATGLVVMANNATSNTYWHTQESLGAPPAPPAPAPAQPPTGTQPQQPGSGTAPKRAKTKLHVVAHPRHVRAWRRTQFTFSVTTLKGAKRAVRGATIKFAGRRAHTNRKGRAKMTLRLRRAGHVRAVATKPGLLPGTATVVVSPRSGKTR
jgi:trimeric autotransporter adhesin